MCRPNSLLVVLLGDKRSDQPDHGLPVREDPDRVGAPGDLLLQGLLDHIWSESPNRSELNALMSGPASASSSARARKRAASCSTRSSWAWTSSAEDWAKIMRTIVATTAQAASGTLAARLRAKWVRHRCWDPEQHRRSPTPASTRPGGRRNSPGALHKARATRARRNAVQSALSLLLKASKPISPVAAVHTSVATTAATLTKLPAPHRPLVRAATQTAP